MENSDEVQRIISLSKWYKVRPSQLIEIRDEYTSYCFDEALAYIAMRIANGEKIRKIIKVKQSYKSFKDLYSDVTAV